MRFNILLAHLVILKSGAKQEADPEKYKFLDYFIGAYMESALRAQYVPGEHAQENFVAVWLCSPYDFVRWSSHAKNRMGKAVWQLKDKLPECPYSAAEFWDMVVAQLPEEYKKHGRTWAMQCIVLMEKESKARAAQAQAEAAAESLQSGDLMNNFAGIGLEDGPPDYLCEELFEQPLVKALLVNVEEVEKMDKEFNTPWMDPSKAIELMEGADIDGILQMMTPSFWTF